MSLPPPDDGIEWRAHKIDTPTYELSPVEKPDMSPYLVHMTGKTQIMGILAAGEDGTGKINACVPSQTRANWYNEEVVCFTDSPIFALDAFRYIKFDRWQQDQRFGIGFSKSALVNRGVRPVSYIDNNTIRLMAQLKERLVLDQENNLHNSVDAVLRSLMPLIFPLGENYQQQGFMWEREWRYADGDGFEFSYDDIAVICCPQEEIGAITQILGDRIENIKVVQAWDQYDEITRYIHGQVGRWEVNGQIQAEDVSEGLRYRTDYMRQLSKLDAYESYLHKMSRELEQVQAKKLDIQDFLHDLEQELVHSGEIEAATNECFECKEGFGDEDVYELLINGDHHLPLCLNCYTLYMS